MGIKDLYKVINENAPECRSVYHLSDFRGYRFAVDVSIFLNKYIKSAGEKLWMNTFFLFLCTLKKHGIKTVCVFDGPNPPPEKLQEQQSRRNQGQKSRDRLKRCKEVFKILTNAYNQGSRLVSKELQEECKILFGTPRNNNRDYEWAEVTDAMDGINNATDRLARATIAITSKHREDAKKIVEMMGIPFFQADGEAEALCAHLAIHGHADAVLTEDTDVLAYGSPWMVAFKDFKLSEERIHAIHLETLLEQLSLNQREFRDLCILLECDYNHRIMGYPPGKPNRKKPICIGYKNALLMINEYRNFEEMINYIPDPSPLIWERCREIFTPPLSDEFTKLIGVVPLNKKPDIESIKKFIIDEKLTISIDYIKNCWKPIKITFQSDNTPHVDSNEEDTAINEIINLI